MHIGHPVRNAIGSSSATARRCGYVVRHYVQRPSALLPADGMRLRHTTTRGWLAGRRLALSSTRRVQVAMARRHVWAANEHAHVLLLVHIPPQLIGWRRGRPLGHLDGRVDVLADLRLHRLELLRRGDLVGENDLLQAFDGVACAAHAADFLAVAVRHPRVGHGVSVVAVRVHLDHHRARARARVRSSILAGLAHGEDGHAIDLDAGHIQPACIVVRVCRRARLRCAHPVLVVLADKDARQLPERRHVHRLIQLPLV
mmetsp:Transcript_15316/g.39809  ORF Transcript_15316/g.39809 Transcript_15316/m.39809 type:complete len:257 (+) Transcript_15316:159-929(+)